MKYYLLALLLSLLYGILGFYVSDSLYIGLGIGAIFALTLLILVVPLYLRHEEKERKRHGEIPFKIALPKSSKPGSEELARLINSTAGKEKADPKLEKILHLLSVGDIDYETAKFAIRRYFSK